MEQIDYRQLCQELFGTDDVEQLRTIANTLQEKNSRNAGRKQKFSVEDLEAMRNLLAGGVTITEIAERYGTSRQTVSKYLTQPTGDGYTTRLVLMYHHSPCTIIDVDFLHQKIKIQNRTNDLLHRAFGVNEQPTWDDFEQFLQDRCFPESRGLLKEELRAIGLDSYDPLQIVEKTKGRTAEDDLWVKISYPQKTPQKEFTRSPIPR